MSVDDLTQAAEDVVIEETEHKSVAGTVHTSSNKRVLRSLDAPITSYSYEKWREVIQENIPELEFAATAAMAVTVQMCISDVRQPLCLVLQDVPSSGKTTVLNMFKGIRELFTLTDTLSPKSFVSNIAGRTEKQLQEIDLLPRINEGGLIVPDLATIFSESEDGIRERLGLLTRILDGEGLNTSSGVHGERGYQGINTHVMLMATTQLEPRVLNIMHGFGPRMLMLDMLLPTPTAEDILKNLTGESNFSERFFKCKMATEDFVRTLWQKAGPEGVEWENNTREETMQALRRISHLSLFASRFRGNIKQFREDTVEMDGRILGHSNPVIEHGHRLAKMFTNIARGYAWMKGRTYITMEDTVPLENFAISIAPSPRPKVMREIIANGGTIGSKAVAQACYLTNETVKKEFDKMRVLQIGTVEGSKVADIDGMGIPMGHSTDYSSANEEHTFTLNQDFMDLFVE